MSPDGVCCPHENLRAGSRLTGPFPLFLFQRLVYLLRTRGVRGTMDRIRCVCRRKLGRKATWTEQRDEALHLQPGELVQIKSEAEIRQTLDEYATFRGLAFLDEMRGHCGKRFRVHKRLERMFLEESREFRRLKNTVLLDGVMCQGTGVGCDRSCFLFWREAWLKRVPEPGEGAGSPQHS